MIGLHLIQVSKSHKYWTVNHECLHSGEIIACNLFISFIVFLHTSINLFFSILYFNGSNVAFSHIYHYSDVIISAMASQITSSRIVYSTVYSGTDQRKHQSSASLAFVRWIHRWPENSPHKGPLTRKMFPFDDVIMPPAFSIILRDVR